MVSAAIAYVGNIETTSTKGTRAMLLPLIHDLYRRLMRWHERRDAIRHLRELDDYLLYDIGIDRADIERVVDERMPASESEPVRHKPATDLEMPGPSILHRSAQADHWNHWAWRATTSTTRAS
jgi:uncharacterized protein YjiS (DUF1127 family)